MVHNLIAESKKRLLFSVTTERDLFLKMSLQFVIGHSDFYTSLVSGRVAQQTPEYLIMHAREIFIFHAPSIISLQMQDSPFATCP